MMPILYDLWDRLMSIPYELWQTLIYNGLAVWTFVAAAGTVLWYINVRREAVTLGLAFYLFFQFINVVLIALSTGIAPMFELDEFRPYILASRGLVLLSLHVIVPVVIWRVIQASKQQGGD